MLGLSIATTSLAFRRNIPAEPLIFDFASGLPEGVTLARESAAGQFTNGTYVISPPDTARLDADGLLIEGSAENLMPNARPTADSWSANSVTVTDCVEQTAGYFNGIDIASTGVDWARASQNLWVYSDRHYAITLILRPGTSDRMRLVLRNTSEAKETRLLGPLDALSVTQTAAGALTILSSETLDDGVLILKARYSPTFSGNLNLGIGPDSTTSGQDITVLGVQVETGPIPTSFANPDRAADHPAITGLNGTYTVTAELADNTVLSWTDQVVTDGYWPTSLKGRLKRLIFQRA